MNNLTSIIQIISNVIYAFIINMHDMDERIYKSSDMK